MNVADLIMSTRAVKRLSRRELAELTGLCKLTISRIESGEGYINATLYVLAKALDIPMDKMGDAVKVTFLEGAKIGR